MDIEKTKQEPKNTPTQTGDWAKISNNIRNKFTTARHNRNQAFKQFRNRTLVEYVDDCNSRFNNFKMKPDWKDEWQANISDISTHSKLMAIVAQMIAARTVPVYVPIKDHNLEARLVAGVLSDIYRYTDTEQRNGKMDALFMILRALRDGTVIGWEGIKKTTSGKKVIDAQFIGINEFYPQYVKRFSMDDQGHSFARQIMGLEEAKARFYQYTGADTIQGAGDTRKEKKKNIDMVQPAGNMTTDNKLFFEISEDIKDDEVEVLKYFDKIDNQYHVTANNFLLTPPGTTLTSIRPDRELGFWKAGYEPWGDDFFYLRAFVDLLADNQDAIDFLFDSMFDQTLINTMRPLLTGDVNTLVDDYFYPARVMPVTDVDQMKWMDANPLDLTAFRVLQELQNRNTFASIDPTTQGKVSLSSPTATEIERVQENAKKMFLLFSTLIEDALEKKALLRGHTIVKHYIGNPDYKQFLVSNAVLPENQIGLKKIRVVDKQRREVDEFGVAPELVKENQEIMGASGVIEIEARKFKNFEFMVKAETSAPIETSKNLKRAFLDRLTQKMYQLPQIFPQDLVAKIDIENNRDVLGEHTDELLQKITGGAAAAQQQVPGSDIMQQLTPTSQAAVPNLKKLVNEPI